MPLINLQLGGGKDKMKKIFIYATSCKLRFLDATRVRSYFARNNYEIVNSPKDAEIIFYITCAAMESVTDKSLQTVKEFQKYDAELIVAGCLPGIENKKLADIFNGRTINTKDLDRDPDKMDELFPDNKIKFRDIDDANYSFQNVNEDSPIGAIKNFFRKIRWIEQSYIRFKLFVLKNLLGENSFFYNAINDEPMYRMRISWGCNCNCSYCGIRNAIGKHTSKPLDQCLEEFKKGFSKGEKHFMLNADDIGSYGVDIKSSFSDLMDKMTSVPGEYQISIANLNPQWIVKHIDELDEIFKREKIVRIGAPMQSGSSRILKLMNRFHDTERIKDAFLRLKKAYPKLSIHTHIMLGFPAETEEDFQQTLSFIKNSNISAGQFFPFSLKTGTEAENIEPKISQDEIDKRLKFAKNFLKKSGYTIPFRSRSRGFLFEEII